ncbi:Rib/alpha-like domain-containing protein [Gardnerella sp. DNF00983]|uniref:Rib/alpha-like domain-containing protein n=1 Tax=Gardnerella sp. DNF00983 TaxID=2749056 RepID=UPI003BA9733E
MFNSHIFSRFLRLVRSIRRSLFAFFVAIAMLLATFVIAPTYALSAGGNAGESATSTEKVEGAKAGSTKSDVEQQQPDQSESNNNTEPNKKNTGSSSTLTNNKESKSVEKQNSDSNKVDDKAKSTDSDVKKNVKDAKNKAADSAKAANNGTDRVANEEPQLPEECRKAGMDKLAKCYVAKYEFKYKNKYVSYANITKPDESYTGEPKFYRVTKLSNNGDPSKLINVSYDEVKGFVKSFSLEGIVVDEKLLDSKEETNKFVEVDSTSGAVTIRPNNWLKKGYYDVYVKVEYKDGSALTHLESCTEQSKCKVKAKGYEEYLQFRVKIRYNDTKNNNVLSLKVYNHQKAEGRTEVDDVPFTLNKDGKFNPSTIFIDSQSSGKFNRIYHRMICHKDSDSDYYLNSINNDLTLSDSDVSGSAKSSTQKQWEHRLGNRTSGSVLNDFTSGELYENDGDSIGERSQSWITGTPKVGSEGKYTCRVFAINDANFSAGKVVSESYVDLFDSNAKDKSKLKSAFDNPMDAFGNNKESLSKKKGIDWDYKTITIQFGDEPPKIGDNDLTLKVYPFKDSTTALTSDNNKISAILGMSLKPFVDATSAADSANKITLRVLCSKGKKKDSGSRSEQPSEPSQLSQTAGSPQAEESLEYKTWSSNLAELGLSVPGDDNQNTCHSDKEGEKTCASADPKTNVAARTDMEVSIKPTEVGNYQCVVYALKPKALAKFDGLTGSLTPATISSALTTDPASFKENKDFAAFTFNIHSVSNFTLPNTGGQSWNLQLGILAALLVNLLAAGFVISQSERGRKLILGRWRGLCNYV